MEKYPLGQLAGGLPYFTSGSEARLRHEVVSVIVVLGVMPRHNPLSHQRYPTEMCGCAVKAQSRNAGMPWGVQAPLEPLELSGADHFAS